MIRRCRAAVPVTSQIGKLTDDTIAGTTHRYWDGRTRSVPRIGNRIILPRLALLAEGGPIEPTHHVDLAVARVIDCAWEIPTSSIWHGRAHAPAVRRNIVDLRRSQDKEVGIEPAEHIDLVGVRGVRNPPVIEAGCHIRQRRPDVRRRVIPVKGVGWQAGEAAC
jgi:hypothetical protein